MCLHLLAALPAPAQAATKSFFGRWDLTVHTPRGDSPSWIEVRPAGTAVSVLFVGPVGSAQPATEAAIAHGELTFSVPADDAAHSPQRYRASLNGGTLAGHISQRDHPDVDWTGKPAPKLLHPASGHWGPPQTLFDGKSLAGWHFTSSRSSNWSVANGLLVSTGRGADLVTNANFTDLQLHVEWRCGPGANSGVYLRGRYEVQIETDSAKEPPSHHTGGVYGFLAPEPEQPRRPHTWQSFDITLIGRTVTVLQNGITILDGKEIPGITGGALNSDEAAPGPIVLQGGEDGRIEFRNLRIRTSVR